MNRSKSLLLFILLPALFGSLLTELSASTQFTMHDGFRNKRYGEIILIAGGPLQFVGHVYNTVGLNDCPQALWDQLDPKQIARENKARSVILNGPRYFMMDEIALQNPGPIKTFGGLEARHLADVKISLWTVLRGKSKPYTGNTVERTSRYVYKAGRPIFELIAPDGRRYVMQTYALIVDKTLQESDLPNLGERLKLPKGWKYQTRILEEDLVLTTSGTATVLQDDLMNSYQLQTNE